MPRKYVETARNLPVLESFNEHAFVSSDKAEQGVCDFILALALIHDDLRDVLLLSEYLYGVQPQNAETSITAEIGEFRSTHLHVTRLLFSTIHELATLMRRDSSQKAMAHPGFTRLERHLPTVPRNAWRAVRDGVRGESKNDVGVLVEFCRHKVHNHYEAKPLGLGYRRRFVDKPNVGPPLLSRGDSLATTRFFFADASAEAFMRQHGNPDTNPQLVDDIYEHVRNIAHALRGVVLGFIVGRSGWRVAR